MGEENDDMLNKWLKDGRRHWVVHTIIGKKPSEDVAWMAKMFMTRIYTNVSCLPNNVLYSNMGKKRSRYHRSFQKKRMNAIYLHLCFARLNS